MRSTRVTAMDAQSPFPPTFPRRTIFAGSWKRPTARSEGSISSCATPPRSLLRPLAGISDDQFRKILENNVIANHWLIGFAAPQMKARKDGAIIIVSSVGGIKASAVIGAYNISKAADFQLARNLALEFGPDNIRVNCIAPGLVKTDFARALWENPQTLKATNERTPLGRIGEPDEIAGAAVFLASRAGAFMTGQAIVIDGGATIT